MPPVSPGAPRDYYAAPELGWTPAARSRAAPRPELRDARPLPRARFQGPDRGPERSAKPSPPWIVRCITAHLSQGARRRGARELLHRRRGLRRQGPADHLPPAQPRLRGRGPHQPPRHPDLGSQAVRRQGESPAPDAEPGPLTPRCTGIPVRRSSRCRRAAPAARGTSPSGSWRTYGRPPCSPRSCPRPGRPSARPGPGLAASR